jgi:serine/threonine-protein kinase
MGQVFEARHLQLNQPVAIKTLLPHALRNPELVARFEQEARATVRIQSEHVVKVLDVGQDRGSPLMVMEYLEGQDLAATLKRRGPLPLAEAVTYVLQACEALAEAHKHGIVHRDLKPANLFLTARADGSPLVKVLDFGISKATLASGLGPSGGLTMDSSVMGSPNYMSPEQLKNSKDVDARTDVWSLGLVLYELLSGAVAFQADTLAELHVSILQSFPGSLLTRRPDLPPGLEAVVLRCLHKDRNFRYASVGELAVALADFAPDGAQISVDRVARLAGLPPVSRGVSPSGLQHAGGASGWNPPPGMSHGSPPATSAAAPSFPGGFAPPTATNNPAPSSFPPGYVPLSSQVNYTPQASQPGYAPVTSSSGGSWSAPQAAMPLVPVAPVLTPMSQPVPTWIGPPQQQAMTQRKGPPVALIVLAVIVGMVALGGAGCVALVVLLGA